MSDHFDQLARVELLDGWPKLELERWRVYDEIAPSKKHRYERDVTVTDAQIRRVFEVASEEATGVAASVADQRLAQFEILDHAELYAALGGLSPASIREEQEWWAPNWSWFLTLRELQEAGELSDPVHEDFHWVAPILLTASADRLSSFYGVIARSGTHTLQRRQRGRLSSGDRAIVTLLIEMLRERGRRFLHGPDAQGRYLAPAGVDELEVGAALADLEEAWDEYRSTLRGKGKVRTWTRREHQPATASHRSSK